MATDYNEVKLTEWADKLDASLDRQESKGGNCVVLSAEDCRELLPVMRGAASALDGWANDA